MHGVTTAIVLFVFVCVLFPRLITNRPQYYAGFVCALLVILLDAAAQVFGYRTVEVGDGLIATRQNFFYDFAYVATAVLQVAAIVLLFLSAGGLTVRGLTKEMAAAFEVIRRGETEKEVIIPFGEQKERKRALDTIGEGERVDLTAGPGQAYPTRPTPPRLEPRKDDGPIPMD